MALKGLGNRVRQIFKDVWDATFGEVKDFAENDIPPLVGKIWGLIGDAQDVQSEAIGTLIEQLADNPREAISAGATVALVPTPFTPLVLGMLVSGAMGTALQFATMDASAQKSWAAERPLLAEKAAAQWEATLAILPEQIRAQVTEQLKYAVEQAAAQWEGQKPLLVDQAIAEVETRLIVRPNAMPQAALFSGWFRDILPEGMVNEQLAKAGYPDEVIAALKEAAIYYPPPSDLITFVSREVYEPQSVERYGLLEGLENVDPEPFRKGGMTAQTLEQYWIAHWQHSPLTRIIEMFRRDILVDPADRSRVIPGSAEWREVRANAEDAFFKYFNLVETAPYWRTREIALSYENITRTDGNRMWVLGFMDDNRYLRNLLDWGYRIEDATAMLAWAKVELMLPSIKERYRNLWINSGDVMEELLATGVPPQVATRIWQTQIVNLDAPLRVAKERDLTKLDIVKAFKTQRIPFEDAVARLIDIGYDQEEAEIVILNAIPIEEGE